jgi:hypothetical protein
VSEWAHAGPEENPVAERSRLAGSVAPAATVEESPRDPYHNAEAIRRLLTDLARVSRYERRAAAKRDRAVRRLLELPPTL